MNDHVLSFFIYKFTDGKEGGGLCVRRQRNNVGYETLNLLKPKKQTNGFFFLLLSTKNSKSIHFVNFF